MAAPLPTDAGRRHDDRSATTGGGGASTCWRRRVSSEAPRRRVPRARLPRTTHVGSSPVGLLRGCASSRVSPVRERCSIRPSSARTRCSMARVQLGLLLEQSLDVLASLAEALVAVREPGPALFDDATLDGQVEQVSLARDSLTVHHIELGLAERRRELVLDDLDPGPSSDDRSASLMAPIRRMSIRIDE